jgi:hypothetical protein
MVVDFQADTRTRDLPNKEETTTEASFVISSLCEARHFSGIIHVLFFRETAYSLRSSVEIVDIYRYDPLRLQAIVLSPRFIYVYTMYFLVIFIKPCRSYSTWLFMVRLLYAATSPTSVCDV